MSRKLVIDDGRSRRELLLVGTMVVGRDPACEISHSDPRLSRRHAEFRVTPDGVTVRDLDSRNGIRVNDQPVKQAVLRPGDRVQVAHLTLTFAELPGSTSETLLIPQPPPRRPAAPAPPPAPTMAAPAAVVEDDRTRVVHPTNAAARVQTAPVQVVPQVADDRTRVAPPAPTGARPAVPPPAPSRMTPAPVPTDVGDLVIRDHAHAAAPAPPTGVVDLSLQALAARGWGRRVLGQGLLLSLVAFFMACVPLLAWQRRAGISAVQSWSVLLPALLASTFAGVMVASLIARTTARGLDGEHR